MPPPLPGAVWLIELLRNALVAGSEHWDETMRSLLRLFDVMCSAAVADVKRGAVVAVVGRRHRLVGRPRGQAWAASGCLRLAEVRAVDREPLMGYDPGNALIIPARVLRSLRRSRTSASSRRSPSGVSEKNTTRPSSVDGSRAMRPTFSARATSSVTVLCAS